MIQSAEELETLLADTKPSTLYHQLSGGEAQKEEGLNNFPWKKDFLPFSRKIIKHLLFLPGMRPALDQFKGQHWGNYCSVHRQGRGGVGGGINRLLEWPGTVLDWSGLNCWQGQGLWYGLAGIVIWSGRKERSESVLAGHPRYATCAERKLMYICIYNLYKDKTMSWEQLSPKNKLVTLVFAMACMNIWPWYFTLKLTATIWLHLNPSVHFDDTNSATD